MNNMYKLAVFKNSFWSEFRKKIVRLRFDCLMFYAFFIYYLKPKVLETTLFSSLHLIYYLLI